MTPAGYRVLPPAGSPMLILDRDTANNRAAWRNGTVTPVYSLQQVVDGLLSCSLGGGATLSDVIDVIGEWQEADRA